MTSYRKVRLSDVAKAAGVSEATVSAALRGPSGSIRVSGETQKRIRAIARELGYVPNQAARNLRSEGGGLIAVFSYEGLSPADPDSEFYGFTTGIQKEAAQEGLDLLFINSRQGFPSSRITLASGAVMIGVNRKDEELKALMKRGFPMVFVGRRQIDHIDTRCVTFDYATLITKVCQTLSTEKGILLLSLEGSAFEPEMDKAKTIKDYAERTHIPFRHLTAARNKLPDEAKQLVKDGWFLFIDRIFLVDVVEKFLLEEQLPRHGFLLEDNWMHRPLGWDHWSDERMVLGSLAVQSLASLLKGNELEEPLVQLSLVKADA